MADVETKAYQLYAQIMQHKVLVQNLDIDPELGLEAYFNACQMADDELYKRAEEIWNE